MGDEAAGSRRFDLDGVPLQQRSKVWKDALNTFFYDFDFRLPDDFAQGELSGGQAGDLTIARVRSDAMAVHRTASHITRDALDSYFVLLPTRHRIALAQRGRDVIVQGGRFAVVSTSETYAYTQQDTTAFDNLIVPGNTLRAVAPQIEDRIAQASDDTPLGRMFYDLSSALCGDYTTLDAHARHVVSRQVIELLGLVLDGADGTSAATPIKLAHYRRILRMIDAAFGDPALDIDLIARRLRISKRYIQTIFADHGTTVSRTIRERRIAEACRLIAARKVTRLPISEIAFRVGYGDLAHFSHAFKRATGVAPSAFEDARAIDRPRDVAG